MSNPLRHIDEAKKIIQEREKQRAGYYTLEHRGAMAAEISSDELTMMRAEMSTMRELLGMLSAHIGTLKQ